MSHMHFKLPEINELQSGLESALRSEGIISDNLKIVERCRNVHASTFPSVIATCLTESGSEKRLLFKFSDDLVESHGHRGGVEYEAKIYRYLLDKLDLESAPFFGVYRQGDRKLCCMILGFLDNSIRVSKTGDQTSMINAARWIGEFHAISEAKIIRSELSFIRNYNAEYYAGWAERTSAYAKQSGLNCRWIDTVCDRFDEVVEMLLDSPTTIIHGEYYSQNILSRSNAVYPVDWESAAISVGEIDLATLTEGWPEDDVDKMVREYERSRWPDGVTYDFREILRAARVYLCFRWLGDRAEWTANSPVCFDSLYQSARQMGWL